VAIDRAQGTARLNGKLTNGKHLGWETGNVGIETK